MELKDVILSTLDEIEKDSKKEDSSFEKQIQSYKQNAQAAKYTVDENDSLDLPPFLRKDQTLQEIEEPQDEPKQEAPKSPEKESKIFTNDHSEEIKYLENMREKMLVLFEGFQSPNNKNIEAKLDLTINFLEYILSTLDERLDKLRKE